MNLKNKEHIMKNGPMGPVLTWCHVAYVHIWSVCWPSLVLSKGQTELKGSFVVLHLHSLYAHHI